MANANLTDIARIANRLTDEIAQPFISRAFEAHIGMSFGFEAVEEAGRLIEYLNTGDSYTGTVLRVDGGDWVYSSPGDEVEAIQAEPVEFTGPNGFGFTISVYDAQGVTERGDVTEFVREVADRLIDRGVVDSAQDGTMRSALEDAGCKDEDEWAEMDTEELLQWTLFAFCPQVELGEREAYVCGV